jgi:hypothetical protein
VLPTTCPERRPSSSTMRFGPEVRKAHSQNLGYRFPRARLSARCRTVGNQNRVTQAKRPTVELVLAKVFHEHQLASILVELCEEEPFSIGRNTQAPQFGRSKSLFKAGNRFDLIICEG